VETGLQTALAQHYALVQTQLLEAVGGRPVAGLRAPHGLPAGFVQHDLGAGAPIPTFEHVGEDGLSIRVALLESPEHLAFMVHLMTVEMRPWCSGAEHAEAGLGDVLAFELEAVEPADAALMRRGALLLRDALAAVGLGSNVQLAKPPGLDVLVPLDRGYPVSQLRAAERFLAGELTRRHPDVFSIAYYRSQRAGRVHLGTGAKGVSRTYRAPYSLLAVPGLSVALPITWRELERDANAPVAARDLPAFLRAHPRDPDAGVSPQNPLELLVRAEEARPRDGE